MKVSNIYLGLAGIALASAVHAAPEVEIGGEYNANLTYTNDGLNEPNDIKQTQLNLKAAKLVLRGKLSDQITWNVLYKFKESELERFWLTNKVTDSLDVSIGKQKIKVYGLHRRLTSAISPIQASYLGNNPLTDKVAIDITYKLAGTFSLQLVEDYAKCTAASGTTPQSCSSWNVGTVSGTTTTPTQKQPAAAFEWYGAFGAFMPLVQYSLYDLGKSSTASVGLRFKNDFLDTYVDFTQDARVAKGDTYTGAEQKQKTTYTGIVAYGEFKVDQFSPFVHLSTLATDPYEAPGLQADAKNKAETNANGSLTNNELTYAVGSYFEQWGNYYRPYVMAAIFTGDYLDATSNKKDRSRTDLVAGLQGKF